jgi:hypothetical protein
VLEHDHALTINVVEHYHALTINLLEHYYALIIIVLEHHHALTINVLEHHHALTINVVEHYHALTINVFQSADPYLARALEERFVAKRGELPQSDVMQKSRVTEVCLLQWLHANSSYTLAHFL